MAAPYIAIGCCSYPGSAGGAIGRAHILLPPAVHVAGVADLRRWRQRSVQCAEPVSPDGGEGEELLEAL